MRLFLLAFLLTLTVSCAAPTAMVDIPNINDSNSVKITDLRPAEEKENTIFSMSITNEAYGLYRRGDALLNPSAVRIFQHRVYERFALAQAKPEIKVHHLVVYMNLKSELRRGVTGGVLGGAIGAAIASGTQKYGIDGTASTITQDEFKAFDAEYKRALYSEQENPNKVSVFLVYIDAEIDGKRVFVKTITPVRLPKENTKNPHALAVETATAYLLDQLPKK